MYIKKHSFWILGLCNPPSLPESARTDDQWPPLWVYNPTVLGEIRSNSRLSKGTKGVGISANRLCCLSESSYFLLFFFLLFLYTTSDWDGCHSHGLRVVCSIPPCSCPVISAFCRQPAGRRQGTRSRLRHIYRVISGRRGRRAKHILCRARRPAPRNWRHYGHMMDIGQRVTTITQTWDPS